MGLGVAAIAAALGATLILVGAGVIWAVRPETAAATAKAAKRATVPAAA
jgi:hypothetical protein